MLSLYEVLNKGEDISKAELAKKFSVSTKTIQRDIEDLRIYLAENYQNDINADVVYDNKTKCYKLIKLERSNFTNKDILVVLKILLESRSLNKSELNSIIDKLLIQITPKDRVIINQLIKNERFNYVQPRHSKPLLDMIWDITNHINKREIISYTYERQDGSKRDIEVKPVSIMFSEYYFYLIAYKVDNKKDYPINYRIDRITNLKKCGEQFNIPYKDRFEDGEFRNRVQFMYSGELRKIKFEFSGPSLEAILDRIPTAKIVDVVNGAYTIEAESFGVGIEMWLKTQGENVKIISIR